MRRSLTGLLTFIVWAWIVVPLAVAGNLDGIPLGHEAAMSGGAVTAHTRSGEAAWYNPAGLAGSDATSLDLSASAFMLRVRNVEAFLTSTLPDDQATIDLDSFEIISIPSALVFARELTPGLTAAFALFVPVQDTLEAGASTALVGRLGDGSIGLQQRIDFARQATHYHVGFALGWQALDTLRLGIALYGVYFQDAFSYGFHIAADVQGGGARVQIVQRDAFVFSGFGIGGRLNAGLQWQPIEPLHIGLVIKSPTAVFYEQGEGLNIVIATNEDGAGAQLTETPFEFSDASVNLLEHVRAALGVTCEFDGGWVSVEGEYQPPLRAERFDIDRTHHWNLRAGTRFNILEGVDMGAGLFTDRSANKTPSEPFDQRVDFYGATLGVELRTPYELAESEEATRLEFATTIALRYAIGTGQVGGVVLDFTSGADDISSTRLIDVLFHEASVYIGSTLRF